MTYEVWRMTFQDSEQAARAAWNRCAAADVAKIELKNKVCRLKRENAALRSDCEGAGEALSILMPQLAAAEQRANKLTHDLKEAERHSCNEFIVLQEQLETAEQRAAQAEEEKNRLFAAMNELRQRRGKSVLIQSIEHHTEQMAAQAERDAVRECERLSLLHLDRNPVSHEIRNRYPQHFKGE